MTFAEQAEQAFHRAEDDDFVVYAHGIVHASVCSSLGTEATLARMQAIPTGIRSSWALSEDETFRTGESNPCRCEDKPETHMHYLFNC